MEICIVNLWMITTTTNIAIALIFCHHKHHIRSILSEKGFIENIGEHWKNNNIKTP
ncbi:hypothetical protein HPE56_06880 [Maribacter sp. ANRC-HE7]|uniref:Uncharacterized protein n=1 Tax=Maribacter aquimaris TaxID=2737171 RepID=A0ABR7UY41_9FLAO|nr:hypothetical protein [Maribacter aquimaris]MBD0777510.1 hypothetical protein [Maribacter aquimaris]